jgi:hypothetical protein
VRSLNDDPVFIAALADIVTRAAVASSGMTAQGAFR